MSFRYTVTLNDPSKSAQDGALYNAVAAAAEQWSRYIRGFGVLDIQVNVSSTLSGRASGGPASVVYVGTEGDRKIYEPNTSYEMRTSRDSNGSSPDLMINVDPAYLNTLWLDPNTAAPADKVDGLSVFMHEIAHGLGVSGYRDTNSGSLPGYATPWDQLVSINQNGSAYFTGYYAQKNWGGPVPVTTLNNGQQYFHLFNSDHEHGGQDLMNGIYFYYQTRYDISSLDIAIMRDLGYSVNDGSPYVAKDFNFDGTSDLLWRDASGHINQWLIGSGGQISAAPNIGTIGSEWVAQGIGDMNGDGTGDILYRDGAGHINGWLLDTHGQVAVAPNIGTIGAEWTFQGLGDFNGDGTSDILWRDSAGHVNEWQLNSDGAVAFAPNIGTISAEWQKKAIADFNGDGRADILWQDTAGHVNAWLLNSNGQVVSAPNIGTIGAEWTLIGTGDFNGDRVADLMWRDSAGHVNEWLLDATGKVSSAPNIGTIGAEWTLIGTGDYNGDGTVDLMWRDTAGHVNEWLLDATGRVAAAPNIGSIDSGWTIVA
ncbi:FG-GAP repeat domain-containing protein [Methylorubrum sp. POS3]|uniref:FG-GAP repeat domain-containing protein n=1 Tax=Methylorubrum sp. POS3 TaxID=2998492 RepID=UPI00372AD2B5